MFGNEIEIIKHSVQNFHHIPKVLRLYHFMIRYNNAGISATKLYSVMFDINLIVRVGRTTHDEKFG